MTCTYDDILAEFRSTIEGITTHSDPRADVKGFTWFDDNRVAIDQSSGMTRAFNVLYRGRETTGIIDVAVQASEAEFLIRVAYDRGIELLERQQLMLRDGFDLIKALRTKFDSTIGLEGRWFASDEVIERASVDEYRQKWRVLVQEVE